LLIFSFRRGTVNTIGNIPLPNAPVIPPVEIPNVIPEVNITSPVSSNDVIELEDLRTRLLNTPTSNPNPQDYGELHAIAVESLTKLEETRSRLDH